MKQYRSYITLILVLIHLGAFAQTAKLSLSDAIGNALENNYGIIISRSELEIAEINNNWGNAGRYPSVGFEAASNNSFELDDNTLSNRVSAGIGLNWILFDGFRVNITKSKLENTEDLSSGRLGVLVENTIEDIILAYYGVLLQQEQLAVLKTVMDLSKDRFDYEIKRKEIGSSVSYEVLQAENVYLSDQAAYLEQEMQVRNAIRNVNFLIAEDPAKTWLLSDKFSSDTSHYVLSELFDKMLSNNQTLKNQYVNLLLMQDERALRKAEFFPSVSFSAGMDNSQTRSQVSGSAAQNFGSYSPYGNVRLSYDIYKGGVRKRALKVAQINEEIAQTEIEEIEHALSNELYNLYDYYQVRIRLLHVAERSYDAASLNLQISGDKYRSGAINSFNYRDVQLLYLEASLRKLQAIYNLIDSQTKLTRITGGYLQIAE